MPPVAVFRRVALASRKNRPWRTTYCIGTLLIHLACAAAHAASPDVARFLAARGAEDAGLRQLAPSPSADVTPLSFIDKGRATPTCGLLLARPGSTAAEFVELTGPDDRSEFPYCMGILSMTPFKLGGRQTIAVEYLTRDTREDLYRQFAYLRQVPPKGFVVDDGMASGGEDGGVRVGAAARPGLGIRNARMDFLKKAYPRWTMRERDFIADEHGSFAVFEDGKARECHVAAEAGEAPLAIRLDDIVPGARCTGVLASTRLPKAGTTYYLAMFASDGGRQPVAVMSVGAGGGIAAEKALSDTINRADAHRDIVGAKAALADALR